MKILIGMSILLILPARGEYENCKKDKLGFSICEKPALVTSVSQFGDSEELTFKFNNDLHITPYAFKNLSISTLHLTLFSSFRFDRKYKVLMLEQNSLAGLPNLKKLTIETSDIVIEGNPFLTLPSLTSLTFYYTTLTKMPVDILKSLPNLEELSFEGNRIEVVPSNAFVDVKGLKYLNMADNTMTAFEPGSLSVLGELETLLLGPNSLPSIPVLDGLNKLKKLDLGWNFGITKWEPNKFAAVPNLVEIAMFDGTLGSFDVGMFDHLPKLETIQFHGNDFTVVKKDVFNNLKHLRNLDLSQCRISTIEPHAFSGLNLTKLNLELNRFTKIGVNDFSGLTTGGLYLGWNQIEEIAPGAFNTTDVKRLSIVSTRVYPADRNLWGLPNSVKFEWRGSSDNCEMVDHKCFTDP